MILEKDENNNMITSCKDCVFAKYNQATAWHRIQTGCQFNRIEKFERRGTQVDWIDGDAVSHHKVHTFCNNARDKVWADSQDRKDIEFLDWKVSDDNKVRWSPIIWLDEDIESIENTKKSLRRVLSQKILPNQVIVSIGAKLDFGEFVGSIKEFWKGNEIPLFFNRVLSSDYERQVIDSGLTKITSTYYVAIRVGTELPVDFIERVNAQINDECLIVAIVHNEDKSILMVSTLLHTSTGGNVRGVCDNGEASFVEDKLKLINGELGIIKMEELYD